MTFVRFIFGLLVAGLVVNLGIVVMANRSSQRKQALDAEAERRVFTKQIEMLKTSGRLQRADIAVEWQTKDARQDVLETSLLVRQYVWNTDGGGTGGLEDRVALPVVRVIIPGNRVSVDGMRLYFDTLFRGDEDDFSMLSDVNLLYFAHIYGENEAEADRYSLLMPPQVPLLTRLHPLEKEPTFFEVRLWQFLWDLIPNQPVAGAESAPAGGAAAGGSVDPRVARAARRGLTVTWLPAATKAMQVGETFSAYVGVDGVTLERTPPGGDLLSSMMEEADAMKAAANGAVPVPGAAK